MNKCPVCDYKIEKAIKVETAEGEVVVCCDECAEKVAESPQKYGN